MPTRILVIDNYDSFTYNIVQYLGELGAEVDVVRNDARTLPELRALRADGVLLSPGPGTPSSAGVTLAAVKEFGGEVPVLGVCLGHQAIAEAFGGNVVRAAELVHGKASAVHHRGKGVFFGLPSPFAGGRYHSLIVDRASLPAALAVTAWGEGGEIMGLRHRRLDIEGVQFHPESVLTEHGRELLGNWLGRCKRPRGRA